MAPPQPPQSGSSTPALFRQRLIKITVALVAAQVFYGLLAVGMLHGGFQAPQRTEPGGLPMLGIFVVGLLSSMVSLPIVKGFAKQFPTASGFTAFARSLLQQFFIGIAVSEIAAIAGLAIFFIYADLKTLYFLLWVAATAIVAHFLRIKKALQDFEEARR